MLKNHTGAGQCSPEAIQLQQQDLVPAVDLSSKEGTGGQERSSPTPGREKPFGVTCGSRWCPHAAAAVSPALGRCDTTGTAPSWLCSSGATATFLGAAPPAEEPRSTDSQPGRKNWTVLLWEPGCSHLGKEKDSGKQQGRGAGEELSLQFALFALSEAALADAMVAARFG